MEPLGTLKATAAPLRLANVNTDQLFPARFIKKPRAVGYAQYLFHDIRRNDASELDQNFSLNQARFSDAKVIVAGANFGSGSSREGAVYALYDAGFRALCAPSFGEIFASNCLKNGILTAKLDQQTIDAIQSLLLSSDDASVIVDINSETLTLPSGESIPLTLDPFQKHCLINGLNEIDLSLEFHDAISAFEATYRQQYPWISS